MTNVTNFDHTTGRTRTKVVTAHDRGAQAFNTKVGDGVDPLPGSEVGDPEEAEQQVAEQTVDEVIEAVDAGTLDAQAALDAERQGKNRSTLISQLESRGAT